MKMQSDKIKIENSCYKIWKISLNNNKTTNNSSMKGKDLAHHILHKPHFSINPPSPQTQTPTLL